MLEAKLVTTRREVKQLYTQLAAEEAEHRRLTAEDELAKYLYERDNRIYQGGATTERKFTSSAQSYKASRAAVDKSARMIQHIQEAIDAQVGQENSLVAQVEAELAGARLNLEYSTVQAPCDGVTTNLQLREGDFAHVGKAVLSCVDRGRWLVVANYRERSLERLRPGQRRPRDLPRRPRSDLRGPGLRPRLGGEPGSCDEGHRRTDPTLHPIIVRNSSKRYWLSCGPAEASGWYCTLKTGRRLCRRPSRV